MSNKIIHSLLFLLFPIFSVSQQGSFPQSWVGNWKGELSWFAQPGENPRQVNMELRIQPSDSAHRFSWQIIYGNANEDNRPYTLIAKDSSKGHWVIDEHNGIVLDQYWIAGKLSGAFTVMNSTIINNYWMEEGKLHVEFYSISAKPVSTTGKGDKDSPFVNSYQVKSYQKAVLVRQ